MEVVVLLFGEVVLLYFLIYDVWIIIRGSNLKIKRGINSWLYFPIAYSVLSAIYIEIINISEINNPYKAIVFLFNLFILFYLCFFSACFKNKVVGLFQKSINLDEKL